MHIIQKKIIDIYYKINFSFNAKNCKHNFSIAF
jgi:hypothetical protein